MHRCGGRFVLKECINERQSLHYTIRRSVYPCCRRSSSPQRAETKRVSKSQSRCYWKLRLAATEIMESGQISREGQAHPGTTTPCLESVFKFDKCHNSKTSCSYITVDKTAVM